MKILHICNGDSTKDTLTESALDGSVAVWREMLCEGPVVSAVGSQQFYKTREEYITSISYCEDVDYKELSITEFEKVKTASNFDEVVLWFEYDLFCQINLMACCAMLFKSYRNHTKYALVCVGRVKDKEGYVGLQDYTKEKYPNLYNLKEELSVEDLEYASKIWNDYVNGKFNNHEFSGIELNAKFKYLENAIRQHAKRFCSSNLEYNQIEQKIIDLKNEGITSKNGLTEQLLDWQKKETVYGFGDLQYWMYIDKLK